MPKRSSRRAKLIGNTRQKARDWKPSDVVAQKPTSFRLRDFSEMEEIYVKAAAPKTFSEALNDMKGGQIVYRRGWGPKDKAPLLHIPEAHRKEKNLKSFVQIMVRMRDTDNNLAFRKGNWDPTPEDEVSQDWEILGTISL